MLFSMFPGKESVLPTAGVAVQWAFIRYVYVCSLPGAEQCNKSIRRTKFYFASLGPFFIIIVVILIYCYCYFYFYCFYSIINILNFLLLLFIFL